MTNDSDSEKNNHKISSKKFKKEDSDYQAFLYIRLKGKVDTTEEKDFHKIANALRKYMPKIKHTWSHFTVLIIVGYVLLNYCNFYKHPTNSLISDIRMGLIGVNLMIIYVSCLILPKPSIYRPHPYVWRFFQAFS